MCACEFTAMISKEENHVIEGNCNVSTLWFQRMLDRVFQTARCNVSIFPQFQCVIFNGSTHRSTFEWATFQDQTFWITVSYLRNLNEFSVFPSDKYSYHSALPCYLGVFGTGGCNKAPNPHKMCQYGRMIHLKSADGDVYYFTGKPCHSKQWHLMLKMRHPCNFPRFPWNTKRKGDLE